MGNQQEPSTFVDSAHLGTRLADPAIPASILDAHDDARHPLLS